MGDTPEHLKSTRFQPGHAPTPGSGRPRKIRPLSDAYAAQLQTTFPPKMCKALNLPLGSTWAEAMTEVAFRTALKSTEVGVAQRKEIADRVEGKSAQRFEISGPEGAAWEVRVCFEEPITRSIEPLMRSIEPPIDVKPELPASEDEGPSEPSES